MIETYSGFIAIVGRPNVGKSTLLNRLLARKVSITCRKSHTTRHQICGIKTQGQRQFVFVDTPGLHQVETTALNRCLNEAARSALQDVDCVLFMVDAQKMTAEDQWILTLLPKKSPVILLINKEDTLSTKAAMLPLIEHWQQQYPFHAIFPLAARKGHNVDALLKHVGQLLPAGPFYYEAEQTTDKTQSFHIQEMIREKVIRFLGDELPHQLTVVLEHQSETAKHLRLSATIWVERSGQKQIVIGKAGQTIKQIGQEARLSLQRYLARDIYLDLWVKVRRGWSRDRETLQEFGVMMPDG